MTLLPAPLWSACLLLLWLVLARSLSLGQILLGSVLGLVIPLLTSRLRPATVRVRHPLLILRFLTVIGYDVIASNLEVAWSVLRFRWKKPNARFVTVPLELRSPSGLAALAMITTVVPGTVWSELAVDRSALLLHVWDVGDEAEFITRFKARYERPLQEIFE
jgi:multicomponent K+:H+ antiporter subunit E